MAPLSSVFRRSNQQSPRDVVEPDEPRSSEDNSDVAKAASLASSDDQASKHLRVPPEHIGTTRETLLSEGRRYTGKLKKTWRDRAASYTVLDWGAMILPFIGWLRTYHWRTWLYVCLERLRSVNT